MGIQVALALLVLVIAGLFFQRFQEGRGLDPGFRAEGVLLAAYDRTGRTRRRDRNRQFATRVLEALRAIPGVESAALASFVPLDIHGLPSRSFVLEGRAAADTPERAALQRRHAGLPRDDGHSASSTGSDFAGARRRRGAAAGHRQPGLRRALRARRDGARPAADRAATAPT